ncbi:MAG: lipopolysaccharide transport periplasmic protein LptA [Gammaproteobacteria bacterium]|nr:MAG: lipopolysaccharide transport periplasmic protein LptA [Gammaproteobacteria bacterium]
MSSILKHLTLLLAPVLALPVAALPEDRDQPIEIRAEQVELDDETGIAVYEGSVQLDQGSLQVLAHRLTIHTRDQAVSRIVAEGVPEGEPARYRQIPERDAAPVEARARTITYLATDERVELEGNAHLRQLDDTFAGDRITYDIRERRIAASGGRDGQPVTMTIQPGRAGERRGERRTESADEGASESASESASEIRPD